MDQDVLERAREVALGAAGEAGALLKDSFGKQFWVKDKALGETLTELDEKAEELIKKRISEAFPDHGILAEESGHAPQGEWLWVIDPLDGTTNYSINNPFFCTSISLAHGTETVVGVTHAPMTGEVFSAVKGQRALLNGKPIRVSGEGELGKLLLSYCNGKSHEDKVDIGKIFSRIKPLARDLDRHRAGALELAFVAAGRLGAYMANSQMSWDSSAGALLVREAGGKVTDFQGRPWNIESKDILATNGIIHEELLGLIREALEG
jgi:myo-inositol-1(or 4)-monophosphatase